MTATRILIVDDHPLTRDALAELLAHNGFEVCGRAAGGEEAIRWRPSFNRTSCSST